MSFDIGRDTVLALVAVAWADGKVDPAEAAGIRGAAEQLGLGADDRKVVEAALGRHFDMNEVETVRMNRHTRLFTFAAAAWIASVDGAIAAAEESVLALLADRLGLSQVARDRARTVALGLHAGPPSQRPGGFDLVALKSQLSTGLSQIGDS
ncbi:MAG: TerB family tellurite resistance protein [Polyangiaceae bacterium]|nr:TerB family tellurite resistance protein [Polyangiaceae bacterium]